MKDPALAKPLVRQAIAHAIDRDRIIRDIQRGFAHPTETMLAEGHWARATNLPTYAYDPAKAKQLLAQAGYPNGLSLVFKTSTDAEANSRAQVMQDMMKKAGFNVSIQSNEMSTFFADIGKGNFQMYSLLAQRHRRPRLLLRHLLLEEHAAQRPEPRLLRQSARRPVVDRGSLHVRPRQAQAGIRRGPENRRHRPPLSLALHAVQRGDHAQEHRAGMCSIRRGSIRGFRR